MKNLKTIWLKHRFAVLWYMIFLCMHFFISLLVFIPGLGIIVFSFTNYYFIPSEIVLRFLLPNDFYLSEEISFNLWSSLFVTLVLPMILSIIYYIVLFFLIQWGRLLAKRISLRYHKFIFFVYSTLLIFFIVWLGLGIEYIYESYNEKDDFASQTCISAPNSEGCYACKETWRYIKIDLSKNTIEVDGDIPEDRQSDASMCVQCENEYQKVAGGEIELDDLIEACRDPK